MIRTLSISGIRVVGLLSILAIVPACGGGSSGGGLLGGGLTTVLLASDTIGPSGGVVQVTDMASPNFGTTLTIPAGALGSDTEITLSQVTSGGPYPSNVLTYQLGPDGTTFNVPVTIQISFLPSYLTDLSISDPTTLHIVQQSTGSAPVTLPRTGLDVPNHTVTSTTTHFSTFAVLGYSSQSLQGDYFVAEYGIAEGTSWGTCPNVGIQLPNPRGYFSWVGTMTFDGVGGFTSNGIEKNDQLATPTSGSDPYSVSPAGVLTIDFDEQGTVLAGGEMFAVTTTSATNGMSMRIGLKKGGTTYSNASLNGTYFYQNIGTDATNPQNTLGAFNSPLPQPLGFESNFGTITFDGAGGYTLNGTGKEDQTTAPDVGLGTYTVSPDGLVLLDGADQGQLLAGGEAMLFSPRTAPEDCWITLMVKRTGTFTNAALTGEYWFQSLEFNYLAAQANAPASAGLPLPETRGYEASFGLMTLDGAGNWTYAGTNKTDYTLSATNPMGTYTVAADGTLTFAGGTTGQVLLGGRLAVFTNNTAASNVSFNLLLLRR
jgi:hypothetical protein